MDAPDRRGMRLAELVAVLSLGTDLGLGQPMEHAIPPGHDAEVLGDEPCVTVDLGEEDADYAKRA